MYRIFLHGLFAIGLAFASNSARAAAERPEALIVAQTETGYLLRVPASRLQMTIPSAGLSQQAPDIGGSTDSPRYFNFTDASRGLVLSGWFESADGFTNLPDFWKREQAAWRDHGLPVAEKVSIGTIGTWQVIFYDVSLPGISNHHMRAHYIGAGTWIDLHVSITGSGPDAASRPALEAVLKGISVSEVPAISAAEPAHPSPTADALLALDRQASKAFFRGDAKFFQGMLSDSFVMQSGGARISKSDAVRMIGGVKCDVAAGWVLTGPQLTRIDAGAYVLSYESRMRGSCTANGKAGKIPSPIRAATVWIRNGGQWQIAFHAGNLIFDPTAAPASDHKAGPSDVANPAKSNVAATASAPAQLAATSPADPITNALMAAENSLWDAWKDKDAKRIEVLMAAEVSFVNIFGTHFANKTEAMKDWTGTTCQVTSVNLTDGVGTLVAPAVGILTLTGTVHGTCGGQDISGQKIHANTVYRKDGDGWKWVFGFNSPT